ncbi:MAG: hypothetical protein AAFU03_13620, partial [Bacteroidota bacterium]
PGRPKKADSAAPAKRGPGRPKKAATAATPAKRGPGRPRKATAAKATKPTTAKRGRGRPAKQVDGDVLTKIPGLGDKLDTLFRARGVKTYKGLANMSQTAIKSVLQEAGPRFRNADPAKFQAAAKKLA